jgi:hypothetical protein
MGTASGTTLTTLMPSTPSDAPNPFEPGLYFMVGLVVGYARELADQRSNLVRRPQPPGLDDFLGQAQSPLKRVLFHYDPKGSAHYGSLHTVG